MSNELITRLIADIDANRRLRLPSLIVTFFGDCIVPRGGVVSAKTLQGIFPRLGFEEGAVRTALSRLASDQWILRERRGRNAFYRFAGMGREDFESANDRIYQAPNRTEIPSGHSTWYVAVAPKQGWPNGLWRGIDAIPITPRTTLFQDADGRFRAGLIGLGAVLMAGSPPVLPDWVRNQFMPEDMDLDAGYLSAVFEEIGLTPPVDQADALAARLLLIHEWRRICLRWPEVPAHFATASPLQDARLLVAALYHTLLPASEAWLDTHATGMDGPLAANNSVQDRFQTSS